MARSLPALQVYSASPISRTTASERALRPPNPTVKRMPNGLRPPAAAYLYVGRRNRDFFNCRGVDRAC